MRVLQRRVLAAQERHCRGPRFQEGEVGDGMGGGGGGYTQRNRPLPPPEQPTDTVCFKMVTMEVILMFQ